MISPISLTFKSFKWQCPWKPTGALLLDPTARVGAVLEGLPPANTPSGPGPVINITKILHLYINNIPYKDTYLIELPPASL